MREDERKGYEEHRAHIDLRDECLAAWIGDASKSALVFDFRKP